MKKNNISHRAEIGSNNNFGQGVVIKDGVKIGDGNYFGDFTVVEGNVEIGSGNYIYNYVSIGGLPQHSRTKFETNLEEKEKIRGKILIGDENIIREFTTVHMPTLQLTKISNSCYIMAHCHVAHDVLLEDSVILANACDTGGHARVLRGANLGKAVQIHPRTIIGQYCMIGMGTIVVKNILPGVTVVGNPAEYLHVNSIGLERNSFSKEQIKEFKNIVSFKMLRDVDLSSFSSGIIDIFLYFYKNLSFARNLTTIPPLVFQLDSLPLKSEGHSESSVNYFL